MFPDKYRPYRQNGYAQVVEGEKTYNVIVEDTKAKSKMPPLRLRTVKSALFFPTETSSIQIIKPL